MINKQVNWGAIDQFEWVPPMKACPQDAIWHAEGDVYTHTKMVVEALLTLPEFLLLSPSEQYILFLSALLHDVAKPQCTVEEDGRILAPKHAKVGEKVARELLWDADLTIREQVCSLVRHHGLPLWSLQKPNPNRAVIESSLRVNNAWLYMLAKADILGRICPDQEELLERIEFFKELCLENECFHQPKKFYNTHSRFRFFFTHAEYPSTLYDDTQFEVIIMSGIAGSGKDTWLKGNVLPVVSLDDIRRAWKVKRGDKKGQGQVIQEAYKRAKSYCIQKQSFIWNSTNLTKDMRGKLINTLSVYNPCFRIVYVEAPLQTLIARRKGEIPASAIRKMSRILDFPQVYEVHEIEYHKNGH